MRVLGLIPARGGSKAIPNKNIVDLCGRPLLAWTTAAAALSELDRVVVSTDSDEIATVARQLGVEVPFLRPRSLAADNSRSIDVVLHALEQLGDIPDAVMLLQPTSPLRTTDDINACLQLMTAESPDSVISVVAVSQHPEQVKTLENGRLIPTAFSAAEGTPRQELPQYVIPNGAVFLTRSDILTSRSFYGEDSIGWEMPAERSLNIDDPFDLEVARCFAARTPWGSGGS